MELHWLPVYQRIDYKILTVMNQVHRLSFGRHQRSLLHHIDFHTAQTVTYYPGLHFPAAISLITRSHLRTITQPHTLHKPWTSFHRSPSIVLCIALPRFSCLSVFLCFDSCPCFLDLPFVFPFGLCSPLLGLLLVYSDYPSCLNPLDIVRRSTTHACPRNTLVSYPQHIC